jgi:site-specific DNA-adenine methylase
LQKNGLETPRPVYLAAEGSNNALHKFWYDWLVLCYYCYNCYPTYSYDGQFTATCGNNDFTAILKVRLREMIRLLKSLECFFTVSDFAALLQHRDGFFHQHNQPQTLVERPFVYLDPPYLATGKLYGWTRYKERELLEFVSTLDKTGYQFALSNIISFNGHRNQLLADWLSVNQHLTVHKIEGVFVHAEHGGRAPADECLITNYYNE